MGAELVGLLLRDLPSSAGTQDAFLDVQSGLTLLIGPNGAGKTRTLAGIEAAFDVVGAGPRGSSGRAARSADAYVRLRHMLHEDPATGWQWLSLHLHAQSEVNGPPRERDAPTFSQLVDLDFEPSPAIWLDVVEDVLLETGGEEPPDRPLPPDFVDAAELKRVLEMEAGDDGAALHAYRATLERRRQEWIQPPVERGRRQGSTRTLVEGVFSEPVVRLPRRGSDKVWLAVHPASLSAAVRDAAADVMSWSPNGLLRTIAAACLARESVVDVVELGADVTDDLPEADYDGLTNPVVLPAVIPLRAVAAPADRIAEDHVSRAIRGGAWLVEAEGSGGQFRVPDEIEATLSALSKTCQSLSPGFMSHEGGIEFTLRPPDERADASGRVRAGFRFHSTGTFVPQDSAGSGLGRWIGLITSLACSLAATRGVASGMAVAPQVVMLVDEPELHLHPRAQRSAAEWLQRLASGNPRMVRAVAATHSPELLAVRNSESSVVAVRGREAHSPLHAITPNVLLALDELADELGMTSSSWLHAVRAVLCVEGEHDLRIVEHFYGAELAARQVRLLPLRGSDNALTVVESNLFASLGVPVRLLLDNLSNDLVNDLRDGRKPRDEVETSERKMAEHVMRRIKLGGDFDIVPLPEPDIVCCLPVAAVRRAFPDAAFSDWADLTAKWHAMPKRRNFKYAIEPEIGLQLDIRFVEAVLAACTLEDRPSASLDAGVQAVLDVSDPGN